MFWSETIFPLFKKMQKWSNVNPKLQNPMDIWWESQPIPKVYIY